tara:strand:- start:308 stop:1114 length:807 start_codon:yes stop_codon:yes gene_type:complete
MKISFKKNLIRLFPNLMKEISNNFQYNSFSRKIDKFDDFKSDYDSLNFIKKLESSFLISKKNNHLFDRDGQIVLHKNNNFKLISYINQITKKNKKNYILDFGGSLCNFYRINKLILNPNLDWIIFDREDTVKLGKKLFKKNKFNFFSSLKDLNQFVNTQKISINLCLFGSSLQYVKNLEEILSTVKKYKCKYILIDRQPMLISGKTSYRVQKVPFWNGGYSFPVKLYNYKKFIAIFKKHNFILLEMFKGFGNDFKDGKYITQIYKRCS